MNCIIEEELVERAIRLYLRRMKRAGLHPSQPSRACSDMEGNVITLANINGELAKYRYDEEADGMEYIP